MRKKLILSVLLIVSYECEGGLLDGILYSANEAHKHIQGAAGAVLGGITGFLGINQGQQPPQDNRYKPGTSSETIVVVVNNNGGPPQGYPPQPGPQNSQNPYLNNYRPQSNQGQFNQPDFVNPNIDQIYQQGTGSYNNNGQNYRPGYQTNPGKPTNLNNQNIGQPIGTGFGEQNNFGQPNIPNYGQTGNGNQNNLGQSNIPNYQNNGQPIGTVNDNDNKNSVGQPNNQNFGKPTDNEKQNVWGQYNNANNNGQHIGTDYDNGNQNNFEQPNKPTHDQHTQPGYGNHTDNNNPSNSYNHASGVDNSNSNGQINTSAQGQHNPNHHNTNNYNPHPTVNKNEITEKTPSKESAYSDQSIFVPLGAGDYVYGGDKITINHPKDHKTKEASTKKEDDDEAFNIDIRLQDD